MIPPNVWRIFSSFSVCNQVKEGHRGSLGQIDKVVHGLITDDERRIVLRIVLATSDPPLTRCKCIKIVV